MILPVIECKLDYFFIFGFDNGIAIESETDYKKGKYIVDEGYKEYVDTLISEGRYFNDDETTKGENVAIIGAAIESKDGIVNIAGTDFNVIGQFYDAAVKYVGDVFTIPEFDGVNNSSDKRVYRDIIFVAILFIVLSVINYCIMYEYILQMRKDKLAIYRICGCRRKKAFLIYMSEILGESLILLVIGVAVFKTLVLPKLSGIFEYITYFFETETYIKISLIYVCTMIIAYGVLVLRFIKDTPVEMIKEV